MKCRNLGCEALPERRNLENHEKLSSIVPFNQLDRHLQLDCPLQLVDCPLKALFGVCRSDCPGRMTRESLQLHVVGPESLYNTIVSIVQPFKGVQESIHSVRTSQNLTNSAVADLSERLKSLGPIVRKTLVPSVEALTMRCTELESEVTAQKAIQSDAQLAHVKADTSLGVTGVLQDSQTSTENSVETVEEETLVVQQLAAAEAVIADAPSSLSPATDPVIFKESATEITTPTIDGMRRGPGGAFTHLALSTSVLEFNLKEGVPAVAIFTVTNITSHKLAINLFSSVNTWFSYVAKPNLHILKVGEEVTFEITLTTAQLNLFLVKCKTHLARADLDKTVDSVEFYTRTAPLSDAEFDRLLALSHSQRLAEVNKCCVTDLVGVEKTHLKLRLQAAVPKDVVYRPGEIEASPLLLEYDLKRGQPSSVGVSIFNPTSNKIAYSFYSTESDKSMLNQFETNGTKTQLSTGKCLYIRSVNISNMDFERLKKLNTTELGKVFMKTNILNAPVGLYFDAVFQFTLSYPKVSSEVVTTPLVTVEEFQHQIKPDHNTTSEVLQASSETSNARAAPATDSTGLNTIESEPNTSSIPAVVDATSLTNSTTENDSSTRENEVVRPPPTILVHGMPFLASAPIAEAEELKTFTDKLNSLYACCNAVTLQAGLVSSVINDVVKVGAAFVVDYVVNKPRVFAKVKKDYFSITNKGQSSSSSSSASPVKPAITT
eukprot:gene25870-32374_t